jgi:hypothetical protein
MRREASLNQWKQLFEVAQYMKALKPWEHLWDLDVITISLPEYKENFYCSIMGKEGNVFAVGVYDGTEAIHDFYEMANHENIPWEQLIRYQNNLMCYFGNRTDLEKVDLKIIKELGIKFYGKNDWIYFRSFERGYAPFMLNGEEVVTLTEVLQELGRALEIFLTNKIPVDFEKGNTLLRQFNHTRKEWDTLEAPNKLPHRKYPLPVITDELLLARLKKQKSTWCIIELDTLYLNASIKDENYEKPILPVLLALADFRTGTVLNQEMLMPDDDDVEAIINMIISYILKNGKPQKIFVRDEYVSSILFDLCSKIKISLEEQSHLDALDEFTKAFNEGDY